MNIIMDLSESAFVSTRALADMEDALICDGGATSTPTKSLENSTLIKQKVVEIQTAHGGTQMSTTHCHQQTALCVFSSYHAYIFIYAENTHIGCMRK